MKFKGLLLLALLLGTYGNTAYSARIEQTTAQTVAINFMAERNNLFAPERSFNFSVADVIVKYYEDVRVYYAINFSEGGYAIVAADDILIPVIGYAYTGSYSTQDQPCCFADFMNIRAEEAAYLIRNNFNASAEITDEWSLLRSGSPGNVNPAAIASVQPLIMSPWNQNFPYNALCPEDPDGPGGHVYAGCVATAMAMIMYYHRYPDHGQGSRTHYSSYGPLYVNFGETYYDWNAMQNVIGTSSGNSIVAGAELQYHCGVAVNMQYSPNGSGAFSHTVPSAMVNFFRYSNQINYITRQGHSYTNWANILKGQFDSGYPVYYQGHGSGGGHAWVCDGYEDQGTTAYFHMNWGWGGSFNGFFHLDDLNPGGGGTFNSSQGMVRNFYPPSENYPFYCSGETNVITSTRGSIDDGSGPVHNYQNNANCSWLIAPTDSVNTITLNFIKFNTLPNDVLTVYDGADENTAVLGSFHGSNLPPSITSSGNRLFIRFNSDASGNASGWLAEFTSSLPVYCSGMTTVVEPYGEFSDGSGAHNYNNNSLCRWYIKPPGADSVTLNFTSFDIEPVKDFVQILQIPGNQVLGQFSGNELPPPVTSTTGEMMIIFRANQFHNAPGWTANWTIGEQVVLPGDANCDGSLNLLDIVTINSYILGDNPSPFCFENADLNSDNIINVLDVVGTVNVIMGGKNLRDYQ